MAPSTCRPSDGDRSEWVKVAVDPLRETPFECAFVEKAIGALSQEDYDLLESFRKAYPTLHVEIQGKSCNSFLLFRTNFHKSQQVPKGESSNQQNVSCNASELWNGKTAKEKAPYVKWAKKLRHLHATMYGRKGLPPGLKAELEAETKRIGGGTEMFENQKSHGDIGRAYSGVGRPKSFKAKKVIRNRESRKAVAQHYPSPSVSDDSVLHDERPTPVESEEDIPEDEDEEYLPNQRPSRKRRAPASAPTKQKRARYQLPSPALTARELSPLLRQLSPPPRQPLPPPQTLLLSSKEVSQPPQHLSSPLLMYPPNPDSPSLLPLISLLPVRESSPPPQHSRSPVDRLFHPDDPDCPSLSPGPFSLPPRELSISHQCEPSPYFSFTDDADDLSSHPTLNSGFDDPILAAINMNFDYNVRLPMETLMLDDPYSNYHISFSSDPPPGTPTSAIAFSSDGYTLSPTHMAMDLDEAHLGLLPDIDPVGLHPVLDGTPCYINASGNFTTATPTDAALACISPSMLTSSSLL